MAKSLNRIPDSYVKLIIAAHGQLGGTKANENMKKYIFGARKPENIYVLDIDKMWKKFVYAAQAFCSITYTSDIVVVSGKEFGRKPVLKFCELTGATPITGRFIPGSFTNYDIKKVLEPRLMIVSDPFTDSQAIIEGSHVNLPCIGFCNTDNETKYTDVVVPMNNRSPNAIAVGFFILSRLINYMKHGFDLEANMKEVELFFYRDATELEQLAEEQRLQETAEVVLNVNVGGTDSSSYKRDAMAAGIDTDKNYSSGWGQ